MKIIETAGITALALACGLATLPEARAQSAAAPATLSFNWEGAQGRANILVWPSRPGGPLERLVAKNTNGSDSLEKRERLFGIRVSPSAMGEGGVARGTKPAPAATGTY